MTKRLLISFAHPDDESFGLGGLIARYVSEGVEVYLICATNGEAGTVAPEMLNGYKSIAELRLAELDCATAKLGFKQVYKLGYRDSGMMGSATTENPDCLWYAWQHTPEELVKRVTTIIREVKPHVVITFNKYGGYGHPDHIAIQRATVEAFKLAGDANYQTDGQEPYAPQKLYYNGMPKLLLRVGIFMARLARKDPRHMGRNNDMDMVAVLDNVEPEHTRVDIHEFLEAWNEASACHASQGGGFTRSNIILRALRRWRGVQQGFTRVQPAPKDDKVDETDLFAGVNAN